MRKAAFIFLLLVAAKVNAQKCLPVSAYWSRDTIKPLIFYVSGDGGLSNSFSPLLKKMNALGFSIIGLNAQSYFWKKKKLQRATEDFAKTLTDYMTEWHCKKFVLVGYSFGADVIPFIENRMTPALMAMNKYTILMSPSKRTDFEIHMLGMIGCEIKHGHNIPKEINKMQGAVTVFFGSEEHHFPVEQVKAANVHFSQIPGGHHYHSDVDEVIRRIVNTIN